MASHSSDVLTELVEQSECVAREGTEILVERALTDPNYIDSALETARSALTHVLEREDPPVDSITEPLPELFFAYPDVAEQFLEPLSRMANHEDPAVRREGIRCLGCLGVQQSVDTAYVGSIVAAGLADENEDVQKTTQFPLSPRRTGRCRAGRQAPATDR